MSDVWSRAWCETQNVPNFALKGITPSNEIRDPPKYVRHVTSEPLDDDAFYRAYHEEFCDDDSSDTRCFNVWNNTKHKISRSRNVITCSETRGSPPPSQTPIVSVPIIRSRYPGEKAPNFISSNNDGNGALGQMIPPTAHLVTPPLSPGRVRVVRGVDSVSSSVSSMTPPSPVSSQLSSRIKIHSSQQQQQLLQHQHPQHQHHHHLQQQYQQQHQLEQQHQIQQQPQYKQQQQQKLQSSPKSQLSPSSGLPPIPLHPRSSIQNNKNEVLSDGKQSPSCQQSSQTQHESSLKIATSKGEAGFNGSLNEPRGTPPQQNLLPNSVSNIPPQLSPATVRPVSKANARHNSTTKKSDTFHFLAPILDVRESSLLKLRDGTSFCRIIFFGSQDQVIAQSNLVIDSPPQNNNPPIIVKRNCRS